MSLLTRLRGLRLPALVVVIGMMTGGCVRERQPQNYLAPEGPIARQLDDLWNPVFAVATVIFVIVQSAVIWVMFRYRRRSDDESPKQIHGSTPLELGWTITPALILAVVAVGTIANIGDLDRIPRGPDVLQVKVIGHQWWWEYQYPETGIVTANEMHIPAESVIDVRVTATDVVHSFWPPKLAGKIDAVPGRINHMQIKTEGVKPGTFWGQCAEYCGLSHANMRLKVIVHSPEDYRRWERGQLEAANVALDPSTPAGNGASLFRTKGCGGCHTINGYTAGEQGPNLTHFMSRKVFAGAIFRNDIDSLRAWLRNPPKEKPMDPDDGMGMPNLNLAENEISDLIAFLQTLK